MSRRKKGEFQSGRQVFERFVPGYGDPAEDCDDDSEPAPRWQRDVEALVSEFRNSLNLGSRGGQEK